MPLTCLNTLVGLSNRECTCFDTGRPLTFNTSSSGYFLTDREYGFQLKNAVFANIDCGQDNIWDELEEARTQAIRDVKSDIQAGLSKVRNKRIRAWSGRIGTIETEEPNTYHSGINTVVGVQILPRQIRYASFKVKAIWLYLDTTGDVDVSISSNDTSFSGSTVTVSAVAGQAVRKALDSELDLPFKSFYVDELKYNFSYEPGAAKPLWNKVQNENCAPAVWWRHMYVNGFSTPTLDNNHDAALNDAFGLAIEGYFDFQPLDWICDLTEKGGDEFLDMIARLIQLKGAIKLISNVIDSDKINYYTLLSKEAMYGKRNRLAKLYSDILIQLVNEVSPQILEVYGQKKSDPQIRSIIL